jgi:hypothetical protein
MQHLVPSMGIEPLLDHDARLVGTADSLPPAVILDFIYGIAAYRRWRSHENVHKILASYFKDHYEPVLKRPSPKPTGVFDSGQEDDDEPKYPTYSPPDDKGEHQEYLDAMDDVLELSMMIRQRMTPQEVLMKVQQQQDEMELRERDISRMKVEEWRRTISEDSSVESSNPIRTA